MTIKISTFDIPKYDLLVISIILEKLLEVIIDVEGEGEDDPEAVSNLEVEDWGGTRVLWLRNTGRKVDVEADDESDDEADEEADVEALIGDDIGVDVGSDIEDDAGGDILRYFVNADAELPVFNEGSV